MEKLSVDLKNQGGELEDVLEVGVVLAGRRAGNRKIFGDRINARADRDHAIWLPTQWKQDLNHRRRVDK